MIIKRIYKLEQDDLDVLKEYYKNVKGVSNTNQSMVKVAVENLVKTIKRENDEKQRRSEVQSD